MNTINKLYLSLGLLVSIESATYTYQEEIVGTEIIDELEQAKIEEAKREQTLLEIDAELYDLFAKFFDEKDTMPFSKIVVKVIAILKTKKNLLEEDQHATCDEIIRLFEKNKYNTNFAVWARILITPELLTLMSEKTRTYINSVSACIKIKSLRYKLNNNNPHSFF